jgi:hypothetical protein
MVIVNSASVISQRQPVTYTVQSSDPSLVNPTLTNNNLTLTYGAGLRGAATVTVTATEAGTGATVEDSFDITIGSAMNVPGGQGANAQKIVFTDADGTTATVSVAGGSAVVSVGGDNLTQTTDGRTVTVKGTSLVLTNMVVTGTYPSVTVSTVGGADGRITLGAFNAAGTIRSFSGRGVILRGTATFGNSVGRLDLAGTQGATIDINTTGSQEPSVSIGNAVDTDITSQAPLRLKLGTWGGTDANADTITAPAIRNLQVNGDFTGALDVNGSGQRAGAPAVGNVRVTGGLTGAWTVASLNSLHAGTVANAVIRSGGGIGSIVAGSITGSTIFAGLADTAAAGALPTDKSVFSAPVAIGSVSLKSKTPPQFTNSVIAAATLGKMNLGVVAVNNSGTAFGLAADAVGSVLATAADGAPIRGSGLTDPGQSITQTDFNVRVL